MEVVQENGNNVLGTIKFYLNNISVGEVGGITTLRLIIPGGWAFVVPAGQTVHRIIITEETNATPNEFIVIPIGETATVNSLYYVRSKG